MKCPHDQTELYAVESESFDAQVCPSCSGVFLKINEASPPAFALSQLKPGQRSRIPKAQGDLPRSPASGQPMFVFNYRGVEIDYCSASNSVWLDAGELEKIVEKSEAGQGRNRKKKRNRNLGKDISEGILNGLDAGFSGSIDSFLSSAFESLF